MVPRYNQRDGLLALLRRRYDPAVVAPLFHLLRRPGRAAILLGLALGLCLAVPGCRAEPPQAPIAAQIAGLERTLAKLKPGAVSDDLRAARQALSAGYLYASLYDLEGPMAELAAMQQLGAKRGEQDLDAFEKDWQAAGPGLRRRATGLTAAKLGALPAAVRALVEGAAAQSDVYYRAARLYGEHAGAPSGRYYLGIAQGHLDFALFAAGLAFPPGERSAARSPEAAIAALDRRLVKSFDRPGATQRQGLFNDANSVLGFAGELTRQGKLDAGTQTYLDAALRIGLAETPAVAPSDAGRLARRSRELGERLAGRADRSVGLLYWQLAQPGLAALAKGQTAAYGAKQAAVILDDVLPRYFAVSAGPAGPESGGAVAAAARQDVTVTLVRWPFT